MAAPKREAIRTVRVRHGIKRRDLAETVGISYKHMWGIEVGSHPASIEVLNRIANALGVDIREVHDAEPPRADAPDPPASADEASTEGMSAA